MRAPLLLAFVFLAPSVAAQHHDHAGHGGRGGAAVPSGVSADEAAGLAAGAGLGLARPAEVHGYPGPLHVLELADALDLTADQRAEAERLRAAMLAEAVPLGERVVEAERRLDALFTSGAATDEAVEAAATYAAVLRGQLRAAHLRAHVAMRAALSAEQAARYAGLRGHPAPPDR